jgi:hypothetical protein
MRNWIEVKGIETGVTCWVQRDEIDTIQYVNPHELKSDLIIMPGQEDKKDICIIHTKSGNKLTVLGTPDDLLKA